MIAFRLLSQLLRTGQIIDNSTIFISTIPTMATGVKLNTGAHILVISLGTWKSKWDTPSNMYSKSAGYKGIDIPAACVCYTFCLLNRIINMEKRKLSRAIAITSGADIPHYQAPERSTQ